MNSAPPAPRNAGRLAAFAVAAFAIVVLAALVTQIVLLQAQLRTVREQRAIAERQSREALPLLRAARPLADDLHAAAPDATALARRAAGLLRQAKPLIRDLNAADAGQTLRGVSMLTDALLRSDVGGATRVIAQLASQLVDADVAPRLAALLAEAERRELLRKAEATTYDVATLRRMQRSLLRTQRQSLRLMRRSVALQERSLATQRSTEAHAASLDRKTGGPLPPQPAGALNP
jgi:hypothetical protein